VKLVGDNLENNSNKLDLQIDTQSLNSSFNFKEALLQENKSFATKNSIKGKKSVPSLKQSKTINLQDRSKTPVKPIAKFKDPLPNKLLTDRTKANNIVGGKKDLSKSVVIDSKTNKHKKNNSKKIEAPNTTTNAANERKGSTIFSKKKPDNDISLRQARDRSCLTVEKRKSSSMVDFNPSSKRGSVIRSKNRNASLVKNDNVNKKRDSSFNKQDNIFLKNKLNIETDSKIFY
jgi:hypothetical protein